jgi:DNA-binding NtrC family response regulator
MIRNVSDERSTGESSPLRDALHGLLDSVLVTTGAEIGAVLLLHPDARDTEPDTWTAGLRRAQGRWPNRTLEAWARRVQASEPNPERWANGAAWSPAALLDSASETAMAVPLIDDRRIFGLVQIESPDVRRWEDEQVALLREASERLMARLPRLILRELSEKPGPPIEFIGSSPTVRRLERELHQVARSDRGTVLLSGERGSGKDVAARAIHYWSRRRRGPFLPVLTSALPDTLATTELFGHERAAFTGAESRRLGRFEAAAGGTLFLDEVADLNPALQSALLRTLENREIYRLGRNDPVAIDTRVIAATNRDLPAAVRSGSFRADLLDRLSVFEVVVPPLRDRREDIPALAEHYLLTSCTELQRRREMHEQAGCRRCSATTGARCATPAFHAALQEHDWPGNIRELGNLMLRLMAAAPELPLRVSDLPERYRRSRRAADIGRAAEDAPDSYTLRSAMRRHITMVMALTGQNKSHAARLLGVPYTTLQSKLKRLGIATERQCRPDSPLASPPPPAERPGGDPQGAGG